MFPRALSITLRHLQAGTQWHKGELCSAFSVSPSGGNGQESFSQNDECYKCNMQSLTGLVFFSPLSFKILWHNCRLKRIVLEIYLGVKEVRYDVLQICKTSFLRGYFLFTPVCELQKIWIRLDQWSWRKAPAEVKIFIVHKILIIFVIPNLSPGDTDRPLQAYSSVSNWQIVLQGRCLNVLMSFSD